MQTIKKNIKSEKKKNIYFKIICLIQIRILQFAFKIIGKVEIKKIKWIDFFYIKIKEKCNPKIVACWPSPTEGTSWGGRLRSVPSLTGGLTLRPGCVDLRGLLVLSPPLVSPGSPTSFSDISRISSDMKQHLQNIEFFFPLLQIHTRITRSPCVLKGS